MPELYTPIRLDDVCVVQIGGAVLARLLSEIRARHPRKSFGYLVSDLATGQPTDFVLFEENIRNEAGWRGSFEAYGDYFVIHADAGFVATAEEAWRIQKQILRRGLYEVGVVHSHQRHPANFSRIDYDMHLARFDALWHMIVSMRNPDVPVVRVFAPSRSGTREIPLQVLPDTAPDMGPSGDDSTLVPARAERAELSSLLALDAAGLPACADAGQVLSAIARVLRTDDPELIDSLLVRGFLRGARIRFEGVVAPTLRPIPGTSFLMGSDPIEPANFCGEAPLHPVSVSPYSMARIPVTNEMYGVLDLGRRDASRDERKHPVTGVSWPEAALFALWVGARLPTEAEWEFACGARAETEWCCATEADLRLHAWYSANSDGRLHPVGQLQCNRLGLCDMHGGVWEWCWDTYETDFYRTAPAVDPVNAPAWGTEILRPGRDKVTRGGSYQALPEMCRTRYRFHEPTFLRAADLGFRLACDG